MSGWASEVEEEKSPAIPGRTELEDAQAFRAGGTIDVRLLRAILRHVRELSSVVLDVDELRDDGGAYFVDGLDLDVMGAFRPAEELCFGRSLFGRCSCCHFGFPCSALPRAADGC